MSQLLFALLSSSSFAILSRIVLQHFMIQNLSYSDRQLKPLISEVLSMITGCAILEPSFPQDHSGLFLLTYHRNVRREYLRLLGNI